MLYSKSFIPTLKEAPKDAKLLSHQFLIRAGYIMQNGSGIYSFLPLGKKILDKISTIVKEEMNSSGAHEVQLGFITPASLWIESNRYEKYGAELLRFKDRKDMEFVLGPTHEESMTTLVSNYIKSYRQLPLHLYQLHLKFRDELRPRFGLVRAREFIMKDGYSFHSSQESLDAEFDKMEATYKKIFTRLGLDFRICEADSGAIGGSGSKEFMAITESGEDTLVICTKCDYASNIEIAKRAEIASNSVDRLGINCGTTIHTKDIKSIAEVANFLKISPRNILKVVLKNMILSGNKQMIVAFYLLGDDNLEETKALNAFNRNYPTFEALEIQDLDETKASINLKFGFLGMDLGEQIPKIFDISTRNASEIVTGADEIDHHKLINLKDYQNLIFDDIAIVREGDKCAHCGGELTYKKGIEIGHIFKLGDKYSKALKAKYLDANGREQAFIMGCYGIGVSRLLSTIVEQNADDRGCVFTSTTAPFDCVIIISNIKDGASFDAGMKIYNYLRGKNLDILLDDRDLRFGAKISDFELIGAKNALIVGKELSNNKVQIVKRADLIKEDIDFDLDKILEKLK